MNFGIDREYTRKEIQDIIGGDMPTYLPQKNRVIIAGCFSLELNPDAPHQIQAGNKSQVSRKAELLSRQPETIFPVFLKENEGDQHYQYIGDYKYEPNSLTNDYERIEEAESQSGRYGELSYLFNLIEAT